MRLQIFQLRSVACRLESIRYRLKAMASRITDHPIGGMLLLLPSQSNPSGGFTNWDASFPPRFFDHHEAVDDECGFLHLVSIQYCWGC